MSSLFSGHPRVYEQLAEILEAEMQRKDALHRRIGDPPRRPNRVRTGAASLLRFTADRLAPARESATTMPQMGTDAASHTA
jgi:hypothetical protein